MPACFGVGTCSPTRPMPLQNRPCTCGVLRTLKLHRHNDPVALDDWSPDSDQQTGEGRPDAPNAAGIPRIMVLTRLAADTGCANHSLPARLWKTAPRSLSVQPSCPLRSDWSPVTICRAELRPSLQPSVQLSGFQCNGPATYRWRLVHCPGNTRSQAFPWFRMD